MNLDQYIQPALLFWEKLRGNRNLLPVSVAALLGLAAARLVNSAALLVIVGALPAPPTKSNLSAAVRSVDSAYIDPATIIGGPLFVPVGAESTATSPEGATIQPEEQIKHFKLLGTLEGDPEFARAVLEITGEPPAKEYCTGKKYCDDFRVGNIYIVGIGREFIYFRYQNKRLKLNVGETTQEVIDRHNAELQQQAVAQPQASEGASGGIITKVISREEVNKTILGNPSQIYVGASFGPQIQDGKITGYKIHKVNPDHVFYKLGARPGDIIRKVNDYTLSDTERMFELWKSIKNMPAVKIEVEREGKIVTYDFQIRN